MSKTADCSPTDNFERRLAEIGRANQEQAARSGLWLSHHWPHQYHQRCFQIQGRWVCRRCAALYPLAILIAFATALTPGTDPSWIDVVVISTCSIPATIAYCGEALGWFTYRPMTQTLTMMLAAVGFGRGLGHEFVNRWSLSFWVPLAVFGSAWLASTIVSWNRQSP